jgi:hypothetical protein
VVGSASKRSRGDGLPGFRTTQVIAGGVVRWNMRCAVTWAVPAAMSSGLQIMPKAVRSTSKVASTVAAWPSGEGATVALKLTGSVWPAAVMDPRAVAVVGLSNVMSLIRTSIRG